MSFSCCRINFWASSQVRIVLIKPSVHHPATATYESFQLATLYPVDHGEFPIERLETDRNGAWLGSASHDDVLKLTDVRDALVDSDEEASDAEEKDSDEEAEVVEAGGSVDEDSSEDEAESEDGDKQVEAKDIENAESDSGSNSEREPELAQDEPSDESESEQLDKQSKKRKKKQGVGIGESSTKRGKMDDGFFADL